MTLQVAIVEVKTNSYTETFAFYRDVLGLTVLYDERDHGYGWLSAGITVSVNETSDKIVPCRDVCVQFTLSEGLDAAREALIRQGVLIEVTSDDPDEPFRAIYFSDPNGHRLAIYEMR